MATRALLITYDLNKPGKNYKALYEALKNLGTWWHYLDSTWIVATHHSPESAWTAIKGVVDETDNCLIVDITGDSYQGWLPKEAWTWIHQHVDSPARRW